MEVFELMLVKFWLKSTKMGSISNVDMAEPTRLYVFALLCMSSPIGITWRAGGASMAHT